MGWPAGVGSVALGVLAVVCLVFAVWQVIQIVRWPEGRELIRRMDEERLRGNEPAEQGVTNLGCSDG